MNVENFVISYYFSFNTHNNHTVRHFIVFASSILVLLSLSLDSWWGCISFILLSTTPIWTALSCCVLLCFGHCKSSSQRFHLQIFIQVLLLLSLRFSTIVAVTPSVSAHDVSMTSSRWVANAPQMRHRTRNFIIVFFFLHSFFLSFFCRFYFAQIHSYTNMIRSPNINKKPYFTARRARTRLRWTHTKLEYYTNAEKKTAQQNFKW